MDIENYIQKMKENGTYTRQFRPGYSEDQHVLSTILCDALGEMGFTIEHADMLSDTDHLTFIKELALVSKTGNEGYRIEVRTGLPDTPKSKYLEIGGYYTSSQGRYLVAAPRNFRQVGSMKSIEERMKKRINETAVMMYEVPPCPKCASPTFLSKRTGSRVCTEICWKKPPTITPPVQEPLENVVNQLTEEPSIEKKEAIPNDLVNLMRATELWDVSRTTIRRWNEQGHLTAYSCDQITLANILPPHDEKSRIMRRSGVWVSSQGVADCIVKHLDRPPKREVTVDPPKTEEEIVLSVQAEAPDQEGEMIREIKEIQQSLAELRCLIEERILVDRIATVEPPRSWWARLFKSGEKE